MADYVSSRGDPTVAKRYVDQGVGGDGKRSYAEVVVAQLATSPTIDIGDVQIKPSSDVVLAAAVTATPAGVVVAAGRYNLEISAATWAGATATLQKLRIGGSSGTSGDWISDDYAVASANSIWRDMPFGPGTYRILISGSPTGLNATAWGVP